MSHVDTDNLNHQPNDARAIVQNAIAEAAHFLPGQPPLHAFVHHNTLHAFEHDEFDVALEKASALYGTEPYQSEQAFSMHIASGRIDSRDIEAILAREEGGDAMLWPAGPRKHEFWRLRLTKPVDIPSVETVSWILSERELFAGLHDSLGPYARGRWLSRLEKCNPGCSQSEGLFKLWQSLVDLAPKRNTPQVGPRLRDFLLAETTEDIDEWTRPLIIRLAGAYLDQGVSVTEMPNRKEGFLSSVRALYARSPWISKRWVASLPDVVLEHTKQHYDALDTIIWALETCLIPREQWHSYIMKSLLVLKGWAGMFYQYETRPDRLPVRSIPARLDEFLAVQLTLETIAINHLVEASPTMTLQTVANQENSLVAEAPDIAIIFEAFVAAQGLGIVHEDLFDGEHAQGLIDAVIEFDEITRRRLLHRAYEHHYRVRTLDALLVAQTQQSEDIAEPMLQAVFCMDEREESLRRHLEEQSSRVSTFGYAGFFGVAMSYRGLDDVKARPLCPVVVTPTHLVEEVPLDEIAVLEYQRRMRRRGQNRNFVRVARDDALRGGIWSVLVGTLKIVPLIGCSLFPRTFSRVTHRLHEMGIERPHTRLRIEGSGEKDASTGLTLGYTVEEMTEIVGDMLATMGLSLGFAPIVLVAGHGSSSLNNPHEAAHDCGATGGGRGGPNARAFAMMANHTEVRSALAERYSIHINESTWFVGGYHNTCDDSMSYYDVDLIPTGKQGAFAQCKSLMAQACIRNAHERCRRFESATIDLTLADAMGHAQEHAADLGQPRPEYGHATNAVCVIGRRRSTRNLFLDRRAFLISYDPEGDPSGEALGALLAAAGPVGAGISLEYYFSFIDPNGYGCGTKLPHNISGLVGVMDGHSSDLRTGLPWQMVEIHEPMRLLVVVEATPAMLQQVVDTRPGVAQLVLNHWIQLVSIDPMSGAAHVFQDSGFVAYTPFMRDLPVAESSIDHYAGHREHLDCGLIHKDADHVA